MRMVFVTGTLMVLTLAASPLPAQDFLDKLEREFEAEAAAAPVEPAPAKPPAAATTKTRGYLGLIADDSSGAVRVEWVRGGGAAEKAGILVGDVVEDIDGRPVATLDKMGDLLAPHGAGERVAIRIRRGKVLLFTNAVLGRPPTAAPAPTEPDRAPPEPVKVDALSAIEKLDHLLEVAPPAEAAPLPTKPKIAPARIDALEGELRKVRDRIAELEREIADIAAEEK